MPTPTVILNWNIDDLAHNEHGGSIVVNVSRDFGSFTPDLTKLRFQIDSGACLRDADDNILQSPVGVMPDVLNLNLIGNVAVYDFGGASLADGVYNVVYDDVMVATVYRFFGDVNGDRLVDSDGEDKAAWDATVNQSKYVGEQEDELNPLYNRNLDENDDGFIDGGDLNPFKRNENKHLDY